MRASRVYDEVGGIIGGVGPEATNYLFKLVIKLNPAKKDQEHIPLLIFNNPQIPDRTRNLVYGETDPTDELVHTGIVLKQAGATFLAIPCNTAHAFLARVEKEVGIPVLNMLGLTAKHIVQTLGKDVKVGLLATDGTLKSEIYQKEFAKISSEIELLLPSPDDQKNVMDAIYGEKGIKAGFASSKRNFDLLQANAKKLTLKGAQIVIEGCTEIPLVFSNQKSEVNLIDPMEVLAKEILQKTLASKHD